MEWLANVATILVPVFLVLLNGFFVAAEFALVKVRGTQMTALLESGRPFAPTANWLVQRLDGALSACQLGITMASLALGWVAEPAFVGFLTPLFHWLGVLSETTQHAVAVTIAFTLITGVHLVIGEQVPKIFAIRRPEMMVLWCAPPLKLFYIVAWPLMAGLNASTAFLLRLLGIQAKPDHETPHTEEEIRALVRHARMHGELSPSEQRLIHAVFEFDDMICRRIMVPRSDVEFFDINDSVRQCIDLARRTRHTRYPVCNDSLDEVIGVVHVKDLVGLDLDESFDWKSIMRPPRKVPENMPISKLLQHFQATHQLLAFVIDEYGTVIGIVTLENVLEQIVGAVEDEFDTETPNIAPDGPDQWVVLGSTSVDEIRDRLNMLIEDDEYDTVSGLLMHEAERLLVAGDRIKLEGFEAEVLESRDGRAIRVRLRKEVGPPTSGAQA